METILVPNMTHLHKQTREIIYSGFLKATLKVSKLQSTKRKAENQLRQERVENKAHRQQIKNIQGDLLTAYNEVDKGAATLKFLIEKENTIKLLKKKLKIPATELIQASELTELEKEKETFNDEFNDYKAKLLKLVEEKKEQEKERMLLI